MLSQEIDQLAFEQREHNTIIAEPGEQTEWLCRQLAQWPTRVDANKTANLEFLMLSAARTIACQAERIDKLELVAEPLANMFEAANMNDPISKWLNIGHLANAKDILQPA